MVGESVGVGLFGIAIGPGKHRPDCIERETRRTAGYRAQLTGQRQSAPERPAYTNGYPGELRGAWQRLAAHQCQQECAAASAGHSGSCKPSQVTFRSKDMSRPEIGIGQVQSLADTAEHLPVITPDEKPTALVLAPEMQQVMARVASTISEHENKIEQLEAAAVHASGFTGLSLTSR